ncbi:MAG: hypothetical protein HY908_13760 [Myxococcales bacterium]|nr:hypothetical protein [Myxococcales bacterium]
MATSMAPRDANKRVALRGTHAEVIARCDALHATDKRTEAWKTVLIVGLVLSGVGAVIGLGLKTQPVVAVVCSVVLVTLAIVWFAIRHHDIEDRKLETAATLLRALGTELDVGRPIELDLDFRIYSKTQPTDAWMAVRLMLENGVGLELRVTTRFKRKSRSKRKYTKIKDRLQELVTITYTPPKGKAFGADAAARLRPVGTPTLWPRAARLAPRAATFVYATAPMVRLRARGGWQNGMLGGLVDGRAAVAAVIASYGALSAAGAGAGA